MSAELLRVALDSLTEDFVSDNAKRKCAVAQLRVSKAYQNTSTKWICEGAMQVVMIGSYETSLTFICGDNGIVSRASKTLLGIF